MIEILKYEPLDNPDSKTIAHLTIKLPKMNNFIIRRISQVRGSDGRTWFNLPTHRKDEEYLRFCEFEDNEINKDLLKRLPDVVDKYLASSSPEKQEENEEIPF